MHSLFCLHHLYGPAHLETNPLHFYLHLCEGDSSSSQQHALQKYFHSISAANSSNNLHTVVAKNGCEVKLAGVAYSLQQ